ncbi:tethering factor for nuclear proteasome STS1 [Phyllosticta citriasiana]|uniref:Tethering factor for nuclear proteasome STS1 n=1 Tax=Phyllosticta citriasiana TaxID=595635 RepID=A0ABR1KX99_9PEZI
MNSVLATSPLSPAPHLLTSARLSPSRSMLTNPSAMASSKRKRDDDSTDQDERMSASPERSPSMQHRVLPQRQVARTTKRMRTNLSNQPLALPRLLETLGPDDMRSLLQSICQRHPDIGAEVVSTAPRPSVSSALQVLSNYESAFQTVFPYGDNNSSDYVYNRVKDALRDLLEALKDYTPHFLPPNENQPATSLSYLDAATQVLHRLPNWESSFHNRHKQEAYEEMAKAWALVVREAAKRGGGIQLQYGGWDQKVAKHNELSGNRMTEALNEVRSHLGWMHFDGQQSNMASNDPSSVRQQLLSGTYGQGLSVRVGPW